jgi:hypothetical protein
VHGIGVDHWKALYALLFASQKYFLKQLPRPPPDLILNSNYQFLFDVTTEVLDTGDIEGSLAPI